MGGGLQKLSLTFFFLNSNFYIIYWYSLVNNIRNWVYSNNGHGAGPNLKFLLAQCHGVCYLTLHIISFSRFMIRWSIKAFCHKKKTITMLNCLETLSWDILKALLFSSSIYMLVITKGGTSATGHVLSEFLINYKLVNFNSNALVIFQNDCSINCLIRILFERVTNKIYCLFINYREDTELN